MNDDSAVRFIAGMVAILFTSSLFLFKLSLMFTEILKIKFGLRYQLFWSEAKVLHLVGFFWIFGVVLWICVLVVQKLYSVGVYTMYKYLILPGTVIYVLASLFINGFFLLKLNEARTPPH